MPVKIVLDHPRRHTGRRLRRRLSTLAGGLLLVLGLLASAVAIPASFFAIGIVLGVLTSGEGDPDPFPPPDMPVSEILLAWGISALVVIVGLRAGLRLVRGNRGLVLFLRRFGYDDATRAVTFAATKTIGSSWRLVTLDDAEIVPLGVPDSTRRLFRAGGFVSSGLRTLGPLVIRFFPLAVWAGWAIVGIEILRAENWRDTLADGTLDPYLGVLSTVLEGRIPSEAIGPDLVGVFAVVASVAALAFVAMGVVVVALLLAFPLAAVLFFVSSSADAVREAERSKTAEVRTTTEIDRAAATIAAGRRKVFAPRLVVLRVAPGVWQQAVRRLAEHASVPLIDVSEPTENLVWELEELTHRFGRRCLLVGQRDRVTRLAAFLEDAPPGRIVERLLVLLEGREILAYTTDRRGMRRFARALRAKLLTLSG